MTQDSGCTVPWYTSEKLSTEHSVVDCSRGCNTPIFGNGYAHAHTLSNDKTPN